jgi:hypothetical protein
LLEDLQRKIGKSPNAENPLILQTVEQLNAIMQVLHRADPEVARRLFHALNRKVAPMGISLYCEQPGNLTRLIIEFSEAPDNDRQHIDMTNDDLIAHGKVETFRTARKLVDIIRDQGPTSHAAVEQLRLLLGTLRAEIELHQGIGTAAFHSINNMLQQSGFVVTTDPRFELLELRDADLRSRTLIRVDILTAIEPSPSEFLEHLERTLLRRTAQMYEKIRREGQVPRSDNAYLSLTKLLDAIRGYSPTRAEAVCQRVKGVLNLAGVAVIVEDDRYRMHAIPS